MALLPALVFTSGQSVILSTLSRSYGQGQADLTDRLGGSDRCPGYPQPQGYGYYFRPQLW